MEKKTKAIIALSVVGLYIVVVLTLLMWNMKSPGGDMGRFYDYFNKAYFLLGPVGFVMGCYFKGEKVK
jgi:hypothetical protein